MLIKFFATPVAQLFKELKNKPWTFIFLFVLSFMAYLDTINDAKAKDLDTLAAKVASIEMKTDRAYLLQLAESIHGIRCELKNSKNPSKYLQRQLDGQQAEYLEMVGAHYPTRDC